jgi:hypothetical protein
MSYWMHLSPRLIQSYLVAAIGSGFVAPARTISVSSWRRYDWRLYDTARTDDHLARAAGNRRTGSCWTIRPKDCGGAGLLGLDSAQMAPPWATLGVHRSQLPHGPPHKWTAQRLCGKIVSIRLKRDLIGYAPFLLFAIVKRSQTTLHTAS